MIRKTKVRRKTNETDVNIELDLDGTGQSAVDTGLGFLNHMLELFAFHGSFDLKVVCRGDLDVDDHHCVEDVGLVMGQAVDEALGQKIGIRRYGSRLIPMDEALCCVTLDISGRSFLVYNVELAATKLGDVSTQNIKEFFKAFSARAAVALHINCWYGENDHHVIEAIFKAFALALKEASGITTERLPSLKGAI